MSVKTWQQEYYPVDADEVPADKACDHALQKWRGLTEESLRKHQTYLDDDNTHLMDGLGSRLQVVSAFSCSLCRHFQDNDYCEFCPLSKVRGGVTCFDEMPEEEDEEVKNPYHAMIYDGNPLPMIGWLEKAAAIDATEKR
jgi:recombinational DNA repair protein RecR